MLKQEVMASQIIVDIKNMFDSGKGIVYFKIGEGN